MKNLLARPTTLSGLIVAMAVLISLLAAACGGGIGDDLEFSVRIEDGKLVPETIDVKENDDVVVNVETDEPGLVRIGGYEVKGEVTPGTVTQLRFKAFEGTGNRLKGRAIYFTSKTEREREIGHVLIQYSEDRHGLD